MPTLPSHLLSSRETASQTHGNENGRVRISGTALGFLIPIFALFILGPIFLVLFTRNRRARRAAAMGELPTPRGGLRTRGILTGRPTKISREKARRELKGVTEIVSLEDVNVAPGAKNVEGSKLETVQEEEGMGAAVRGSDGRSVVEQECAICLSTLHAPSPPEPAKLPTISSPSTGLETTTIEDTASMSTPSLNEIEEILRLNICSHEFHAECLTSWFAFGKFSCPICRAVYYGPVPKKEGGEDETAVTATEGEGSR